MGKIRILPDNIANKIAAGEVVERPAAVVKELVENSLDAGCTRLRVDVEAGGKKLVRVTDDGFGMNHDDALLAFERHATSKLRAAEDLMCVATLGFRGEAIPSIAAVSRFLLETRAQGEASGTRVEVNGGKMFDVKEAGLPAGTTVTVRDLFYNLPARRKFLRSEQTEMSHVAALVTHYALANPHRGFVLSVTTGDLLNVEPVSGVRERFYQVFGQEALEQMVDLGDIITTFPAHMPVSGSASRLRGYTPEYGAKFPSDHPGEEETGEVAYRLTGFLSRPQVQKHNRESIFIFLNGRLIRDRSLLHAIGEAYRNVIPPGTFPMALLFLEMPFEEVDVNVHPAKTEVRFRRQNLVHDFLRDSLRQKLSESRPMSTFPVTAPPSVTLPLPSLPRGVAFPSPGAQGGGAGPADFPWRPQPQPAETARLPFGPNPLPPLPGIPAAPASPFAEPPFDPMATPVVTDLADLRPLGQLKESFIVAANSEGLWIIDQHVAHERVLFEQVLKRRQSRERLEGQQLLMPYILRLSPAQQAAYEQIKEELEMDGFALEPFGHFTIAVKASPAGVAPGEIEKLLQEVLDNQEREPVTGLEEIQRKIAASVACHAAIKVNMPLEMRKMQWLLDALSRTESPMTCPHGRPVVLKYSMREILKAFHRI
jgi:DNA mismatch repair protein MutL